MIDIIKMQTIKKIDSWKAKASESPDGKAHINLTQEVQSMFIRKMLHLMFGEDIAHVELPQEEDGVKKTMPLELVFPQIVRNTFMKAAHPLR